MTEEQPADVAALADAVGRLHELEAFLRRQDDRLRAAEADGRRLRRAIDEAADRLGAMLAGERASRAALQAVVDELRAAVAADGAGEA